MIISVFNSKGGVGKSTIAANLAISFNDATLIDADTQATCSFWSDRRQSSTPQLMEVLLSRVPSKIKNLSSAIIDLPGACVPGLQGVLQVSDLIVIPITYDQSSLDALPATLQLALTAGKPAVVLVNRLHPQSSYSNVKIELENIVIEICADLNLNAPEICSEAFRERSANRDWWSKGEAAADHKKSQSGTEIKAIYKWLNNYA